VSTADLILPSNGAIKFKFRTVPRKTWAAKNWHAL
jgi:hypothetical protein